MLCTVITLLKFTFIAALEVESFHNTDRNKDGRRDLTASMSVVSYAESEDTLSCLDGDRTALFTHILDEIRLLCESEIRTDHFQDICSPTVTAEGIFGILFDDWLHIVDILPFSRADDRKSIAIGDLLTSLDGWATVWRARQWPGQRRQLTLTVTVTRNGP